jgi:hypothetical protein
MAVTPRGDEIRAVGERAYWLARQLEDLSQDAQRVCVRLPEHYDWILDTADTLVCVGDGLVGQAERANQMTDEQLAEIDARKGGGADWGQASSEGAAAENGGALSDAQYARCRTEPPPGERLREVGSGA